MKDNFIEFYNTKYKVKDHSEICVNRFVNPFIDKIFPDINSPQYLNYKKTGKKISFDSKILRM